MKRIKIFTLILLSLICFATVESCEEVNKKTTAAKEESGKRKKGEKEKKEEEVKEKFSFTNYEFTTEISLVEAETSPKYSISINLPLAESDDRAAADSINKAIIGQLFGSDYNDIETAIDSFVNREESSYKEWKSTYITERKVLIDDAIFNHYYTITGSCSNNGNGIINYQTTTDIFQGGAHGSYIVTLQNFDAETGKEIVLGDIVKEDCEELLSDAILAALMKQNNVNSKKELVEIGYNVNNGIYPSKDFTIGKDSISFYYNAYDIAPYAMGHTKITLSKEELKNILK